MAMLSMLLALALQGSSAGWYCTAEREVEDRTYYLERSIDGLHHIGLSLSVNWTSGPSQIRRRVEWGDRGRTGELPPAPPSWIEFSVPVSSPAPASASGARPVLRIRWPDGTERRLSDNLGPRGWGITRSIFSSTPSVEFTSQNRDLNRALLAARTIHAVAEDRRGRVLGEVDLDFPDLDEPVRIIALLMPEAEAMLDRPLSAENRSRCGFWTITP